MADACVEQLRGADLILHAGDFVSVGFLEELRALGPRVEGVYGNMDERALVEALPREHVVDAGGARLGMVHIPGARAGREERLAERFAGCDAVVYGHTHQPHLERAKGGPWILNPGSPTERRRAPVHAMLELDVREGDLRPELIELAP